MKKLLGAASVLALMAGIIIAATAPAYAATDRSGAVLLTIPNSSPCRGGRTVLEGMAAGPSGALYIIFSKGSAGDPALSRWVRDGSTWDNTSWTCAQGPVPIADLGHGNDLAYNANYLGHGPALIATQGSQSAFPSAKVGIVHLNSDGSINPNADEVTLPTGNVSGFCYSATAADGAGKYAARRLNKLWTHAGSGALTSGWTLVNSNLTTHDNRSDQGIDCSANYIWNTKSINDSTPETGWNWVYQYNWSGSDVESDIGIPGNTLIDEIEDISHIGSDFFIGINRNDGLADTVNVFTE